MLTTDESAVVVKAVLQVTNAIDRPISFLSAKMTTN